ncbi:uncharacterized protein LOC107269624 isoform X2 [Cephus cinctus]|uniref:Gustatory receptor n=1 Tax=Cephus cinctus TaxID=211228 RepID=A0AAJ7RKP0_CEPCN|nr:uncharacterized protein LOC107269624 isoform X2 [Cephus cinctus]
MDTVMMNFYFFLKMFGLIIVKFNSSGSLVLSRVSVLWSFLLIILNFAHLCTLPDYVTHLTNLTMSEKRYLSISAINRSVAMKCVQPFSCVIAALVARINTITISPLRVEKIANNLNMVDRILNNKSVGKTTFLVCCGITFFWCLIVCISNIIIMETIEINNSLKLLWEFWELLTVTAAENKFIAFIIRLTNQFGIINEKLEEMCDTKKFSHATHSCMERKRKMYEKLDEDEDESKMSLKEKIEHCRIAHSIDRDIFRNINDNYQYFLLISISSNFTSCLSNLYLTIHDGQQSFSNKQNYSTVEIWQSQTVKIITSIFYIIKIVIIVWLSSLATNEGKRSASLTTRLMSRSNEIAVKEQLNLFHDQIMLHDIEFSIVGLFRLRFSVIGSVSIRMKQENTIRNKIRESTIENYFVLRC